MQSLKQHWSFQRNFQSRGIKCAALSMLKMLQEFPATLPEEKEILAQVRQILNTFHPGRDPEESWNHYQDNI